MRSIPNGIPNGIALAIPKWIQQEQEQLLLTYQQIFHLRYAHEKSAHGHEKTGGGYRW